MEGVHVAASGRDNRDQVQRESIMAFTLTAVSPFTVTGIGTEGEYVIERQGYHPQLGTAFRYKDGRYDFYFYVQTKEGLPRRTLSVWYTSSQRFAGGPPTIDAADGDYLEQNIKHYLENVSLGSFDRVEPPSPDLAVVFDWGIRR
jgi:hypothetical protein